MFVKMVECFMVVKEVGLGLNKKLKKKEIL